MQLFEHNPKCPHMQLPDYPPTPPPLPPHYHLHYPHHAVLQKALHQVPIAPMA